MKQGAEKSKEKENWSLAKLAPFDRDSGENLQPGVLGVGACVCVCEREKAPLWPCSALGRELPKSLPTDLWSSYSHELPGTQSLSESPSAYTHTQLPADAELASAESTIQEELKKHTHAH